MNAKEKLYQKMSAEYEIFIDCLKKEPPEKIIDRAGEKVIKEDILSCFEYNEFSDKEAAALLPFEFPLHELYEAWLDSDASSMDLCRDVIDYKLYRLSEEQSKIRNTPKKKRSLEEKLKAANEKVKAQNTTKTNRNNTKERE